MAEIIGIGCTHYPPLITPDADRGFPVNVTLTRDERLPEALKNPLNWPQPMQQEYGDDQGLAAAAQHRARLVDGFRQVRQEILDFNPDFLVIFGDDQYENFREDIIPPSASWPTTASNAPPSPAPTAPRGAMYGTNHPIKPSPTAATPKPPASSPPDCWTPASIWPTPTARSTSRAWPTPSSTPCYTSIMTARDSTSR